MSLLLLFHGAGEEPEPPGEGQPRRLLLGVGLTLAVLIVGVLNG
jgi:hypothetical protein